MAGETAAEPGAPLIRLRDVVKTYGEGATAFQALKGVNLDIMAGDFVAVMGPSGSEERRVGKECSLPCRSRWSPYH